MDYEGRLKKCYEFVLIYQPIKRRQSITLLWCAQVPKNRLESCRLYVSVRSADGTELQQHKLPCSAKQVRSLQFFSAIFFPYIYIYLPLYLFIFTIPLYHSISLSPTISLYLSPDHPHFTSVYVSLFFFLFYSVFCSLTPHFS